MLAYSAVPRILFRQRVCGLWRGGGDGAGAGAGGAQARRLHWISPLGDGSCRWRGLASQARGADEEGFRPKAPKQRRRSVKTSDGLNASAEAAAVELSRDNGGAIHLIIGPMFAGKSTALLRRVQEEASRGRRVALVKSDKDTRYGLSAIVTHDGLQMPCYAVPDLATFKSQVGGRVYDELDVIGVDEAQFFPDLYEFCRSAADLDNKTVIVAGLDGDYLRRRFGSTLDLIPVSDSVVKLSSRCEICERPAIFSFRKTLDTHTELVGGAEVYMPVCRQHFVNGQIVVETASTVIGAHQVAQMSKN